MDDSLHTFGQPTDDNPTARCMTCGGKCVHSKYGAGFYQFMMIPVHREAYETAYTNPDRRAAAAELERLMAEYKNRLPNHPPCTCYPSHCYQCLKLSRQRVNRQEPAEIGRTSPVNAPSPLTVMVDFNAGYMGKRRIA